jgi:hypothetical protein
VDTKVGGLMSMLKPGGAVGVEKAGPKKPGAGTSTAADDAARAFVAAPSAATFRDLMDLCHGGYDEPDEDDAEDGG